MRQQIYHGGNPPQHKLHICRTYAKQVKGRDDKGIQENDHQDKIIRLAGLRLKKHTLDNKAPEAFKQCIHEQQMQCELVPPGNHQCNQAEHAIQTFKVHLILILAGIDDKFPLSLWCQFLKLTKSTLNILCQSKVAPKISAYTQVHGPHAYMANPFAPLGCAIQAHVNPEDRRTWDIGSNVGFLPWHVYGTSPVFPGVHHKNTGNTDQ
jgi:hypothetical protein